MDQSLPDSIFQSALIHWHQWNKKSNLLWLSTLFLPLQARRFFLHDYQIPRKIKVKGLKSIFFRQQRVVSRVRPSLKNANLPEPIWKLFVNQFSGFLGHSLVTFCLFCHDWIMRTLHLAVDPRLQPKSSFSWCLQLK